MDAHKRGTRPLQRQKQFLIGMSIGICILLLVSLVVLLAPNTQVALAQSGTPSVSISFGDNSIRQGDGTWIAVTLSNLSEEEYPDYTHRLDLQRKDGENWVDADSCEVAPIGELKNVHPVYVSRKVISYPNNGLSIPYTGCDTGSYRVRFVLFNGANEEYLTDTREFTVLPGPSIDILIPSGTHYRGIAIDVTIKFHHLIQGESYTYEAFVMNDNPNYADDCHGAGLSRNAKMPMGTVDQNPEERVGTVATSCPTEDYNLIVRLYNSDDDEKASKSENFGIVTDPNATPSVSVNLSESSPIAPGTEFDVTFNFYDIQPGTAVNYRDTMTNTSTNQAVGQMDCGGSVVGWGQEVSGTVNTNPDVNLITIPSDCPAGSYRIISEIEDTSGNDIISGSVDFIIGDPDLTPTAPSVSNMTAKQNSPFSQQLPVGTGGDGTLDYGATGLPAGLLFTKSTRTIAGTPTGTGPTTVRYTVTDSDGDSAYVEFTITVNPDLTPSAPSVSPLTAKQNSPFSHQLPVGSGGDGTLSYGATGLPYGLLFTETTRTIAGTPTRHGPFTVRYTVTDSDGDSAYIEFTITVNQDLVPTSPSISGISARKGSLFSRQLPVGSGGDAPLSYSATNLPTGLSFITATRTITGTPTTEQAPTVTFTVRDSDGDQSSTTFVFTIAADLMPALPSISGYTGRVDSPFS